MNFFNKKNNIIGLVMISVGLIFLADTYFGIKIDISGEKIGPFLLILGGVVIIMKK